MCDTVVPAIARDPDPDGLFARKASDVRVPQVVEYVLTRMPDDQRAGLLALLEALGDQGFARSSQRSREQIMRQVALTGPAAAAGIDAPITLTLFLFYGLPDERGRNPSWRTLGHPGPVGPAPEVERPLRPCVPDADTTLEADVCVVGSGVVGGMMAGVVSERGLKAVVLETGRYFDDADFQSAGGPRLPEPLLAPWSQADRRDERNAAGGLLPGGGTVVNWTTSLRTTP